jgi:hypothetical protein
MSIVRTRIRRAQQFSIVVLLRLAPHNFRSCALQQYTYHAGCQATMSSAAPEHDVVDADKETAASAHNNRDVIPSEEGECGLCQKLFIDSGNDKKVLHLMSIGVSADNKNVKPLFLFEREPS